ncbi:MAG TPA: Crp/Fnr family transcriptional regulator [Candidatus Mediterraneibacter excrementigallinarum]|nr:Crp/Fnr family transcriptional regulator [Candidatus Mediterraneibacter excrementigallinarum]
MLIPRYYFSNDFRDFQKYFFSQPHTVRTFRKNEYLWNYGEPVTHIFYIMSGVARTTLEHENGSRKISSFHSEGTVFPGCHRSVFKIEQSIATAAVTDMETLCFSNDDFLKMLTENPQLMLSTVDWYASYINLLLYESAHQDYNSSFVKLCNLLYLFSRNSPTGERGRIDLTQESIAEILAVTRISAARCLGRLRDEKIIIPHRSWIQIIDQKALEAYCSSETLQS